MRWKTIVTGQGGQKETIMVGTTIEGVKETTIEALGQIIIVMIGVNTIVMGDDATTRNAAETDLRERRYTMGTDECVKVNHGPTETGVSVMTTPAVIIAVIAIVSTTVGATWRMILGIDETIAIVTTESVGITTEGEAVIEAEVAVEVEVAAVNGTGVAETVVPLPLRKVKTK
jgi:hypothetical protein